MCYDSSSGWVSCTASGSPPLAHNSWQRAHAGPREASAALLAAPRSSRAAPMACPPAARVSIIFTSPRTLPRTVAGRAQRTRPPTVPTAGVAVREVSAPPYGDHPSISNLGQDHRRRPESSRYVAGCPHLRLPRERREPTASPFGLRGRRARALRTPPSTASGPGPEATSGA